jgi:hypothetical protein
LNGQVYDTFKEAWRARGLLEDDIEWLLCLQEAAHMRTGKGLHNLFTIILLHCNPDSSAKMRAAMLRYGGDVVDIVLLQPPLLWHAI